MILRSPGACWRVDTAPRAAFILDMADYFTAAQAAMGKARRSIHLLNWAFEADTLFDPQPGCVGPASDRFGGFLRTLAADNAGLDVRLLCWKAALPVAATQNFFPQRDRRFFEGSAVKFVLDGKLPLGACHHQKMIVIDDAVAFCGGGDIGPDRWDTPLHVDDDPRREKTPAASKCYDSRHEVMALVDGPPAAALGDLFRQRWRRATGETLAADEPLSPDAWPEAVAADFNHVSVGLSRTAGAWRGWPEIGESNLLSLASIAAAQNTIYLENQYFTSPIVAEALAARLEEPDGPEVVIVSTQHSPSWFDRMTMDRTRSNFILRLKQSDLHGRFHAYSPVTTLGRTIIVHAKLAIIDDRLLRIGSSNMNNRSAGFDTECDLSLEAAGETEEASRGRIRAIRTRLLAHWLGCSIATMQSTLESQGGVGAALEALRGSGHCRLLPIQPVKLGPLAEFIATFHVGDPVEPADSWRPVNRRRALDAEVTALAARLRTDTGQEKRAAQMDGPS
ncbi:MAG: phospholipase D-like domain-containing protein [Caulobacteraceae bacterium]